MSSLQFVLKLSNPRKMLSKEVCTMFVRTKWSTCIYADQVLKGLQLSLSIPSLGHPICMLQLEGEC